MAIFSRLKRAKPSKTEVVTFSLLDYWSMLDLFDRIPLHDLVRLNGLAPWWSGYVTKVCRTKRSITVQCGDESDRYGPGHRTQDQFNLLKVTTIDSRTSNRLVHLLPSITSLEIIIYGPQCSSPADITNLINQWSHQLVNLKLKCYSYYEQAPEMQENSKMQIKQMLLSLNTLTSLRRLSIKYRGWEDSTRRDRIDLPILSQLEYFYFNAGLYDFETLRHSLVRYAGSNHNLKKIVLPSLLRHSPMNDLLSERQLMPKLTMLNLGLSMRIIPTRDQWALFTNLTTVIIGEIERRSHFMTLLTDMQCLKLLRYLDLTLLISRDFNDHLDQVAIDLPLLASLTNLKFETVGHWSYRSNNSYSYYKSLHLGTIFPNVQSVHLSYCSESSSSSCCVPKWMAKTWRKIHYQMHKLRVQRELFGVKCVFKSKYYHYE